MQISALRDRLRDGLVAFAWDEWAQMGVFAATEARSPWVQDPEALIVFTLEVARHDARLFDELLDWLVVNDALVSTRRLRAMCVDDEDRALVAAATGWVAEMSGRGKHTAVVPKAVPTQPLFHALRGSVKKPDAVFARHGLVRGQAIIRRHSSTPDPTTPVNLAFRLRLLLGTSARAEVVRGLLTIDAPRVSSGAIARGAGYARQNVREALLSLRDAGVVTQISAGAEQRYAIDRAAWARLFDLPPDWCTVERDWPELLGALRLVLRWLQRDDLEDMSPYLRGSVTRDLLELVAPGLFRAGVAVEHGAAVEDAPLGLEATVSEALRLLDRGR